MLPLQYIAAERDTNSNFIGIALVCEDISKGQELVLRYPPKGKDFSLSGSCGDNPNRAGMRRARRLLAQVVVMSMHCFHGCYCCCCEFVIWW